MNSYHFSERVRHALALAREEAARLHHEYVGTEHILLGLTRQDHSVALSILTNLSIDVEGIRRKIEETVKRGRAEPGRQDLPYTSRAKKCLELAMSEARELGHNYVGTEHLLMGLLREEKGIAAQVLAHSGLTTDNARAELSSVLGKDGSKAEGGPVPHGGHRQETRFLVEVPRPPKYQVALVTMWWTLGIVALIESGRLMIRGLRGPEGVSASLVALAIVETIGAILFLFPPTLKYGAGILLGFFTLGFVAHLFRGDFLTQLLVYAAVTAFIVVSRYSRRPVPAPRT